MNFNVVNGIVVRLVNVFLSFVLLKLLLPFLTYCYVSVLLVLPVEVQKVKLINLEEPKRIQGM